MMMNFTSSETRARALPTPEKKKTNPTCADLRRPLAVPLLYKDNTSKAARFKRSHVTGLFVLENLARGPPAFTRPLGHSQPLFAALPLTQALDV